MPNDSRGRRFFAEPDARSCLAAGCGSRSADRAWTRFREPRWNRQSLEWLKLDRWLDQGDLARKIARLVDEDLDLDSLFSSYAGRGTPPHRPDLLLKLVLYEHQTGRPKPTQWLEDLNKNKAVEWLTFGIEVGRSVLYEFRDRVLPFLRELNTQVVRTAIDEKHTDASMASLDGTFIAANASRHRLLTLKKVEERLDLLEQEIAKPEAVEVSQQEPQLDETLQASVIAEAAPAQAEAEPNQQSSATQSSSAGPTATRHRGRSFMGKTKCGMERQRAQYRKAQEILTERSKTNAQRRKDKRTTLDEIRVAIGDPTAPFGRDKTKVFRPIYNVQEMTDLSTDLVFSYGVFTNLSDAGLLVPMIDLTQEVIRQLLKKVFTDSGYPSGDDLAECKARQVDVYAPWNENSHTAEKRAQAGEDGPIRKDQFIWDPVTQCYRCPQGNSLTYTGRTTKQKANGDYMSLEIYQSDPADCKECPFKDRCVHSTSGARTVRRQRNEDLIDEMRDRMKTPEGKALYGLRGCTVERRFADEKTHRAFQRFSGRTIERAEAQVGLTVLAHNLITLDKLRKKGGGAQKSLENA